MRTTLLVVTLLLSAVPLRAQECTPDYIAQLKPGWKPGTTTNLGSPQYGIPNMQQVIGRTSQYFELVRKALPDPAGVVPKYYTVGNSPIATGAPFGYSLNLYFLEMWCVNKKLVVAGETDYWAYIFVNEPGWVIPGNDRVADFTLPNGQNMYQSSSRVTDQLFRGYPVVSSRTHDGALTILIGLKNRLPIRAVTREEAIHSYRSYWVGHYADEIRRLEESKKNMLNTRASPETLKKSGYTDQQIKQLYQTIEESAARHDKLVEGLKADRDKKIPMLDGMLSRMDDEQRLSRARTEYLNASRCEPEKLLKETGTPLVTMDPSYFDPGLPKHAAQCFVVYFRPPRERSKNRSVDAVFDALTKNLDLDALKAMLGR